MKNSNLRAIALVWAAVMIAVLSSTATLLFSGRAAQSREADQRWVSQEEYDVLQRYRRLEEVRQSLEESIGETDSYGLRNIHERLRICYGAAYGLQIDSDDLFGTTVSVRIPKERKEKGL